MCHWLPDNPPKAEYFPLPCLTVCIFISSSKAVLSPNMPVVIVASFNFICPQNSFPSGLSRCCFSYFRCWHLLKGHRWGFLLGTPPRWPCLCTVAAQWNSAPPLLFQLNLPAAHLQSRWVSPFCPEDIQFCLKVFVVFHLVLTSTAPLKCHFLMTFQAVEISSWEHYDIFL